MKAIKTMNAALAASLLAGASLAQAASYDVSGTLNSFSATPAGIITALFNPESPAFTGLWNVDTTSLSGNADFGAYTTNWSFLGSPSGVTNYNSVSYQLNSSTATYDSATRTLQVTGTVATTARDYSCTGAAFFCGDVLPSFDLALTLTFTDASLNAFSGSLTATDDDGHGSSYNYAWSFNGQAPEVTVPAAAWLFGSGLAGMAGLARSRKR